MFPRFWLIVHMAHNSPINTLKCIIGGKLDGDGEDWPPVGYLNTLPMLRKRTPNPHDHSHLPQVYSYAFNLRSRSIIIHASFEPLTINELSEV